MMSNTSKDNNPRKSDAVARTAGKTSTAGGDRNGGNPPRPRAIGGNDKNDQVINIFYLILLIIGLLKFILQHNKNLATEPRVH